MITLSEAIEARHSVRQYLEKPLEEETKEKLQQEVALCNRESGLNIQLILNEPKAFNSFLAHYGSFRGVQNYFALVGKKGKEEACGYYGERLVLYAQSLGLNTCWVALTYKKVKNAYRVEKGEKLIIVIALGYGKTQGVPHKSKRAEEVSSLAESSPAWFKRGVECALLAPTAVNQQKFYFSLNGNRVTAKARRGICSRIDLGIVKYHFACGAGEENFVWENS